MADQFNSNDFDGPILITGAGGCIGSWTISLCSKAKIPIVAFDINNNKKRLKLLMHDEEINNIKWIEGDIADSDTIIKLINKNNIQSIIHLAALQVPFCAADPIAGAKANVIGTVNIFEAARQNNLKRLAYASSVAAHGLLQKNNYLATLYGAYKLCNENMAKVYYQDWKVPSIGIRPGIVYGVGRDQGMTSKTTVATLAAAANIDYTIPFSGPISALHAKEVAAAFIMAVSRERNGAPVFDINGNFTTVEEWVNILNQINPSANINFKGKAIPFPFELSDKPLQEYIGKYETVDLEFGIKQTYDSFKRLISQGKISTENLD